MPNGTVGHPESTRGFATRAIWAGQEPCSATGATIPPVFQTSTYTLADAGVTKGFDYSRSNNPTRLALERQLASLEGARFASAFGSGMAAIHGVTSLLRAGDRVVATADLYGGTHRLFTQVLTRYGIAIDFVDTTDVRAVEAALATPARLLWLETPSNPLLRLTDIVALAELAREKGAARPIVAVDNTFASPYLQNPLSLGADVVVHSTTKYLCGHSDVIGGAVIGNDESLHQQISFAQNAIGAVPGPWDAYLTLRGAKTLALRMRTHEQNAAAVAELLARRDDVAEVYYPGLPSHPGHELARRQMRGFGGIVSFRLRGGAAGARRFIKSTKVFALAVSLGAVESLVCLPAVMTHGSLTPAQRAALGIGDDLIRLSVGLEDRDDLLRDLEQALNASGEALLAAS